MTNPKRKVVRWSWAITGLGLFLILGPMNLGWVEGMKGGYAEFSYSAPSGRTLAEYSVRVPVPPGREEEVQRVFEHFQKNP